MAGRAQAFSDPTVIRLLSEQFIPVAGNSSALQRQQDDVGQFFRHIAEQGHYGGRTHPTTTRQGSYAFTATGQFLASINTRDPEKMAGMLGVALSRWREAALLGNRAPVQVLGAAAPDRGYPVGGLVLQLVARDLPRTIDTRPDDWRKGAWNFDYAWFTRDEAQKLVPEPGTVGTHRAAPRALLRRLARFHLRDCVRGEPFAWPESAIQHMDLWSEVTGVNGSLVHLTLTGAVRLACTASWTRPEDGEERSYPAGFDCQLQGEATWDRLTNRFIAFDLLAAGQRWGANQYNNREDDLGPQPLGIGFTLAGTTPADRTPPHCLRTWQATRDGVQASRVMVEQLEYFREG